MKRHTYTFDELRKVGATYYSDTNFCGVIATAVACQVAFGKARALMAKQGRKHRCGTYFGWQSNVAESLGCSLVPYYGNNNRSLGKVCRTLPTNRIFWVYSTGHVTCVDHGVIMDWAEDTNRKRVRGIYEVIRNFDAI